MENELVQIFELLVALVAAIIAYWQHQQKSHAIEASEEAVVEKEIAEAIQWTTESQKNELMSFFDPSDDSVTKPPESVPARSWKMSDETKRWVTFNHKPDEQASLLKQIAEAEEQKKVIYFISVPGCFYEIEYGLVKGGGRG